MVYTLVKTTLWAKLPLLHPLLGQFSQCNLWCLLEYSVVQNLVPRRKNVQSTLEIKELTSVKLSDQKEAKWSGFTQPVMWKCCHCSLEAYSAVEGRDERKLPAAKHVGRGHAWGGKRGMVLSCLTFGQLDPYLWFCLQTCPFWETKQCILALVSPILCFLWRTLAKKLWFGPTSLVGKNIKLET